MSNTGWIENNYVGDSYGGLGDTTSGFGNNKPTFGMPERNSHVFRRGTFNKKAQSVS
jgi:hypothetical protein